MGILPMRATGVSPVAKAVCRAKRREQLTGKMPVPR